MAGTGLQLRGREALQARLNEMRERMINYLNMRLLELAEKAVTYSKDCKGYKDRTANLKNSISFALYLDGELVTSKIGEIPKAEAADGGQAAVADSLEEYANDKIAATGYTLVIVAGMRYGKYVEDKGYNVLHLTRYYLRDEMKEIFNEICDNIRKG